MSRCFPFPPPGYEKKAKADEEILLNKQKPKVKKHKKEKKNREKREGKERSEEKHKEKKERKDKHKDKKDKHKDKETKNVSVEKDTARPPEHGIVEQLGLSPVQSTRNMDAKFLLELGKRISNNDERSAEKNLLVHKFTITGQGNYEMPSKDKGENQRKGNGRQNGFMAENGFIQKFEGVHRRTLEEVGELVEKSAEKQMEREENNKQYNCEKRGGEQKERDPGKKIGVGLLVEKPIEKQTETGESNKQKNGESRAGKHKEKDPERKSKSKDKKRDKEKKKEERKEKKIKKEQLKQRENGKPEDSMKPASDLLKERCGGEGSVGKRKELETNGFLHDTGIRPSKLQRPMSSTHQIEENGKMTEPFKPTIRAVEDLKGNKKIPSSYSVPANGRILEQYPKTISSTHQIVVNGRKSEPSKTAIRIVADFGDGNKKVKTSFSVAGNGKIMEPSPGPKPVIFTKEIVENGMAEGEGNSKKVVASIFVAEVSSKMEPPTPSLPDPENGRKLELSRSIDQSTSGGKMVFINPKVGSKETMVNSKDEAQQQSVSLKRPSPSLENAKETMVNGKDEAQQLSVSLKRPSPSSKKVKPKTPHPDSNFLDGIDQSTSDENVVFINQKVCSKEITANSKDDEAQQLSVSLKRPSPSSKKVKPKPPHPDSKFLDSIFSVPKVELSEFDDQEWLFGDLQGAKRSKMGSSQVEGTTTKQVWGEAIRLESADIFALPYVIPY